MLFPLIILSSFLGIKFNTLKIVSILHFDNYHLSPILFYILITGLHLFAVCSSVVCHLGL